MVWSSLSSTVARVDASGLVTGVQLGATTIRASTRVGSMEADVSVLPPTRVAIRPQATDLLLRDTVRLSAIVLNARGDTLHEPAIVWASADSAVATVDSTGLVRARAFGLAVIRAYVRDTSSEALVAVTPMVVKPQSVAIVEGDTTRFSATAVDNQGDTLGSPALSWSSSDTTRATVDSNGAVRALKPGTVTIRASVPNASAAANLTVDPGVLVGAGDIATCTANGDDSTASLLDEIPGGVFTLGDNAYPSGSSQAFANCFNPTWGRHKARIRPAPGNHEYEISPGAAPYFAYFGTAAGEPGKGFYAYDYGAWHIVVINSFLDVSSSSSQVQWLRADLAAHPAKCTLAYFHYSLFSSGYYGMPVMKATWNGLYAAGVDVVISGHDHIYERFGPQTPDGVADAARGIRQFIVGTGGRSHMPLAGVAPNSEVRNTDTFGVLVLTLHASGYDWKFVPIRGKTFTDSGSGTCH